MPSKILSVNWFWEGKEMPQLVLTAPAKLNLSLDVVGRRTDGYHLVEMVMQSIELCDHISLASRTDGQIKIACTHPHVPTGPKNLVWQAAQLLAQASGKSSGVTITLGKSIPVAAGLAGGSTDAAAVLMGLNRMWGLNLEARELAQLGLKLGADVPFCLMGGTALAQGIGEKLTPLPPPPPLWVVLLKPNIGVSTAEVYNNYRGTDVRTRPCTQSLVDAIQAGAASSMVQAMGNVLESVTFAKLPLLRQLKRKALELGALAALMSGSGPTIFALTKEYREATAIVNALKHLVDFTCITTFKEGNYGPRICDNPSR